MYKLESFNNLKFLVCFSSNFEVIGLLDFSVSKFTVRFHSVLVEKFIWDHRKCESYKAFESVLRGFDSDVELHLLLNAQVYDLISAWNLHPENVVWCYSSKATFTNRKYVFRIFRIFTKWFCTGTKGGLMQHLTKYDVMRYTYKNTGALVLDPSLALFSYPVATSGTWSPFDAKCFIVTYTFSHHVFKCHRKIS